MTEALQAIMALSIPFMLGEQHPSTKEK